MQVEGGHKADLMFGVLTMIYLMAIQNGIVHYEKEAPEMKIYKDKIKKDYCYETPAKSVFMKGCEILFEKVFLLEEFCIELYQVSKWIAEKLNPLDCGHYVLRKIVVQ